LYYSKKPGEKDMSISSENKHPLLSLCIIAKNEETFLRRCLESASDVADQIILIDTGSQDNTKRIAADFDAEIYDFTWCDDFSKARNVSISYAKGDWILWLDADEQLQQKSKSILMKLLKNEEKPVIYKVQIQNYIRGEKGFKLSTAHRLFNNHKGIQFSGKIHEQVSKSAASLGGEERDSGIILDHYGYALEDADQNRKNQRNRRLLEQYVKDEPDNAYVHYTLAQHYSLTGESKLAKESYQKALDLNTFSPDMKASLLNTMSENAIDLEEFQDARDYALRSIEMIPDQVSGACLLYRISDIRKDFAKSLHWLEKVSEKKRMSIDLPKKISTDVYIDENKVLYHLGNLNFQFGEYKKAYEQLKRVEDGSEVSTNLEFLQKKLDTALKLGLWEDAQEILNYLIGTTSQNTSYWDMLGIVLMKQKKFSEALKIYQDLHQTYPQNLQFLKKLAGLYAKLGDIGQAEILIKEINSLNE